MMSVALKGASEAGKITFKSIANPIVLSIAIVIIVILILGIFTIIVDLNNKWKIYAGMSVLIIICASALTIVHIISKRNQKKPSVTPMMFGAAPSSYLNTYNKPRTTMNDTPMPGIQSIRKHPVVADASTWKPPENFNTSRARSLNKI